MANQETLDAKLTLDEFLAEQEKLTEALLATIELVAGQNGVVLVTPWLEGMGCMCHLAFTSPREAIAELSRTEHIHNCCGKRLRVVHVHFADTHTAVAAIVASQLRNQVSRKVGASNDFGNTNECRIECHDMQRNCAMWCQNHDNHPRCFAECAASTSACLDDCPQVYGVISPGRNGAQLWRMQARRRRSLY